VVIHGGGITYFLRRNAIVENVKQRAGLPVVEEARLAEKIPDRITIDEVRALQAAGDEVILLDARADRNRRNSETQAAGSIRVHPHDPVQDAKALKLSQRATLVVYCA
jgi:hypothetical protein